MELLILLGIILIVMFLIGLIGLITAKENKNVFFNPYAGSYNYCCDRFRDLFCNDEVVIFV
jgi:hypothetical protein